MGSSSPARGPRPDLTTAHFLGLDQIFGAIWDGIKWAAQKAAIIAVAVAKAVAASAKWAWNGLKWFGKKVACAAFWLKQRAQGFGKWWRETASPWIQKTLGKINKWFHDHFGWLQRWVKAIQKNLSWVYDHILRPILHGIDVARAVLRVLADLGVAWAGDLERLLNKWEGKILGLWGELNAYVNSIADVVDTLYNPNGFFRRNVFLWSHWYMARDIATVARLAGIDHDPIAEAGQLMSGQPGTDIKSRGQVLVSTLQTPPQDILEAGQELSHDLELG